MKFIAKLISVILHPLLIPSWGFLVLFLSNNPYALQPIALKSILWTIIFVFTFVVPAILISFLKYFEIIKSLEMKTHGERVYPMMITFLSYFASIFILRHFNAPLIIPLLLTGSIISLGFAGMISIAWKISAHLTAFGGLIAAILILSVQVNANYSPIISLVILLSGIVAWSRIYLNSHNLSQVFSGFILGFSCVFFPVFLTPLFR